MESKMSIQEQKEEGRTLLIQMDLLWRAFGIKHAEVYLRAGVSNPTYGSNVLHGRRKAEPTFKRIRRTIFDISHSKGLKQGIF
jgi:hypothetical protein